MKFILFILLVFFCACKNDLPDTKLLSRAYFENKKKMMLEEKRQLCISRALDAAKLDVDSMIASKFNADILDSVVFPVKPMKPLTPEHIIGKVDKFDLDSVGN